MTRRTAPPTRKTGKRSQSGPRTYGRLQRALDDAARKEIRAALREAGGTITEAARLLGVSRIALRARMNALGVETPKHPS